jgi:zinc transport system substrate-binding protein
MIRSHLLFKVIAVLTFVAMVSSNLLVYASTNQTNQESLSNQSDISIKTNKTSPEESPKLNVVASFYPIYELVKQIGGDKVTVASLIPVGVEPHDFEPTIQQIQNAESADIVFFNGLGFEGSWLTRIENDNLIDTSIGANITKTSIEINPHIWLDPILVKNQVKDIKDALIKLDPSNKEYYESNAINFTEELDSLDSLIRSTLQNCGKKDFIAFHDAFNYFANRYGLKQHSIQGVSPEGEVLPQRMQEVVELARNFGIDVIYSEELVDPRFAEVIAQEIPNGKVLILSPIEGIDSAEQAAGIGYLEKMRENLDNLKLGLQC